MRRIQGASLVQLSVRLGAESSQSTSSETEALRPLATKCDCNTHAQMYNSLFTPTCKKLLPCRDNDLQRFRYPGTLAQKCQLNNMELSLTNDMQYETADFGSLR